MGNGRREPNAGLKGPCSFRALHAGFPAISRRFSIRRSIFPQLHLTLSDPGQQFPIGIDSCLVTVHVCVRSAAQPLHVPTSKPNPHSPAIRSCRAWQPSTSLYEAPRFLAILCLVRAPCDTSPLSPTYARHSLGTLPTDSQLQPVNAGVLDIGVAQASASPSSAFQATTQAAREPNSRPG